MSFDLAVLAMDPNADTAAAGAMFEQCTSGVHRDGDLDERVVRFYEHLCFVHPDCPPYRAGSPWMSMPLSTGIDHVIMNLSTSPRSDAVIELIQQLAARHGLVLWDPQSREAYLPEASGRSTMADVRAVANEHGELEGEFERRLDALLTELSPGWRAPELAEPHRSSESFRDYHRRNAKRMQVAHVLAQRPDTAAAFAGAVLDTIVCDEDVSFNRQLIEPMLKAVGRRRVQQHLITVVEQGGPLQKVCAVRAWYWSQVAMVYRSVQGLRERDATPESIAANRDVADLRAQYRTACLHAFVGCAHAATRDWLARGFVLDESFYPPASHSVVERARQIALADPALFKDLLAKTSGSTAPRIPPSGTPSRT